MCCSLCGVGGGFFSFTALVRDISFWCGHHAPKDQNDAVIRAKMKKEEEEEKAKAKRKKEEEEDRNQGSTNPS